MHIVDGTKLSSSTGKRQVTKEVKKLVQFFKPLLDDRFAMIHTLTVSGRREEIDVMLLGPHGALILKVDASSGRCRCLGDNWYTWDPKSKDFVKSDDNPVADLKRTHTMIESHLTGLGMGSAVPVMSAVAFADPKLQLEHMEPSVSLIEFKEWKGVAKELAGSPDYVDARTIDKVASAFGAQVRVISSAEAAAQAGTPPQPARRPRGGGGPFGLKRWQLIVLVVMVAAYLALLGVAAYFLLP